MRQLKRSGLSKEGLIKAYSVYVRSNLEYCSVVWGPGLSLFQIGSLAGVEKKALSIICRKKVDRSNYEEALKECGLESLQERRTSALRRFGFNLIQGKFKHFLPSIQVISSNLRSRKGVLLAPATWTEISRKSTINQLVRDINNEYIKEGTIFSAPADQFLEWVNGREEERSREGESIVKEVTVI